MDVYASKAHLYRSEVRMDTTLTITNFHRGLRDDIVDRLATMSFTSLDDAI